MQDGGESTLQVYRWAIFVKELWSFAGVLKVGWSIFWCRGSITAIWGLVTLSDRVLQKLVIANNISCFEIFCRSEPPHLRWQKTCKSFIHLNLFLFPTLYWHHLITFGASRLIPGAMVVFLITCMVWWHILLCAGSTLIYKSLRSSFLLLFRLQALEFELSWNTFTWLLRKESRGGNIFNEDPCERRLSKSFATIWPLLPVCSLFTHSIFLVFPFFLSLWDSIEHPSLRSLDWVSRPFS